MSPSTPSEVKLEIGYVLFIDIVGYSQLLITQQSEQIEKLLRIVRGTAQFRAAGLFVQNIAYFVLFTVGS